MKWKALLFVSLFLFSFTAFAEAEIKVANGSRDGTGFSPEDGDLCRSKCDPGQIVVGLKIATDYYGHEMLVKDISVICALPNLVEGWESIQSGKNCRAHGLIYYEKTCPKGFYLKGVKAWIRNVLDGIQLECAPINYNATTPQELFSNEGVLQNPIYGLNEKYRSDNGFPGIPASSQTDLCAKGFFPVEIDKWEKDFCWTPNTWGWDDEICYHNIVSGFRAVCGEASLGEELKTHEIKIDTAVVANGTSFPDNPEGRGNRCESTSCKPGDILVGLEVRTGSLVDNIAVWCSNPNNWDFYKKENCGGDGGVPHSLRCGEREYVRSWTMRTGNAADSIQIECASLNTYASTIDEVLNGPGWWTWEYGVNASAREDNGYPAAPPKPDAKKLCEGNALPVGLEVWHQKFCWANGRACYADIVSGARALCREAFIGGGTQVVIDPSQYFHRDQVVEFIGTFATDSPDSQDDPETSTEDTSEDTPENSETPPAREQCDGQCSEFPACHSGKIMNFCCTCVVPETTPPNNGSNNGGGNAGNGSPAGNDSNQLSDPANPEPSGTPSAESTSSGSSGGGCSLNNNASFDPSLMALFPIALLLLVLRRRRLVRH